MSCFRKSLQIKWLRKNLIAVLITTYLKTDQEIFLLQILNDIFKNGSLVQINFRKLNFSLSTVLNLNNWWKSIEKRNGVKGKLPSVSGCYSTFSETMETLNSQLRTDVIKHNSLIYFLVTTKRRKLKGYLDRCSVFRQSSNRNE